MKILHVARFDTLLVFVLETLISVKLVFYAILAGDASHVFVFVQIFLDVRFHVLFCVNFTYVRLRAL